MSIYQKTKRIIESYPACDIIELEPAPYTSNYPEINSVGGINLKAEDELYNLDTRGKHMISSCVSSALKDGDDPLACHQRAIDLGHETHFIIALASCLTSHKQAKKTYIGVKAGQHVFFEGKHFEIITTGNQNLGLKEV